MFTSYFLLAQNSVTSTVTTTTNPAPITALYALIGALVGAVLTALVNLWLSRLNHKRQIERDDANTRKQAERDKALATMQLEQARLMNKAQQKKDEQLWLRNEKLKIYAVYSRNIDIIQMAISDYALQAEVDIKIPLNALNELPKDSFHLLANNNTVSKEIEFRRNARFCIIKMNQQIRKNGRDVSLLELSREVTETGFVLKNEMRNELGAEIISQDLMWKSENE